MFTRALLIAVASLGSFLPSFANAQDPAEGWMGYAAGTNPGNGKILYMEAKWKVGAAPTPSYAFFSPWFGIESSDNLNLIQPVNPWDGSSWSIYNEYFQWSPENNVNSKSHQVKPGDVLFGSVTYVPSNSSYTIYHSDLNDGWSVTTSIPIQKDSKGQPKVFNIAYIVYEKVNECNLYPSDGIVTFYDIRIEWEGSGQTTKWITDYVDDNCNNRANIINDSTISITWDTTLKANLTAQSSKRERFGALGLHRNYFFTESNSTCADGQVQCDYLPGKSQCCLAGENCIKNVGCRC